LRARSVARNGLRHAISRFAGIVGVADLGQVLLIEQGGLQRPVGGGELLDGRGA